MGFSNLLKRLKKRLRNKKSWLALGSIWLLLGMGSMAYSAYGAAYSAAYASARPVDPAPIWEALANSGIAREVLLVKSYVCGEETERLGTLLPAEIKRYHEAHPHSSPALGPKGQVVFTESIEDLSPRCKQDAYFGLDKNGNLSLFDGLPKGDKVIRTFFQLNVELLKSGLPHETVEQLYNGIKIADLEEYNSVISTFADYAVNGKSRL